MSDAAFLAGIAADPLDRVRRLVYADWLDEYGDPRGELLRVEDAMRDLPAWGDEFWKLKDRRAELREYALNDWLAAVGSGVETLPLLVHGVPDDARGRFRLIREFHDRWHGVPMPDTGGRNEEVAATEARLGVTFGPGLRERVALAAEYAVRGKGAGYLHGNGDEAELSPGPEPGAVALCREFAHAGPWSLVGEPDGGFAESLWAVRAGDLAADDPPVALFHRADFGEGEYEDRGPGYARLTDFLFAWAVQHVYGYSLRGSSHMLVAVRTPDRLLGELTARLPPPTRWDGADYYEAPGVLVRVRPDPEGGVVLGVDTVRPVTRETVPAFLWAYTTGPGTYGGMFVPDRGKKKQQAFIRSMGAEPYDPKKG